MTKLKLEIKSIALADIEKIADFIVQNNKKAALCLLNDFYIVFDNLCKFPNLGHVRKDFTHKNIRFVLVKQNYVIVYNIENDTICILRVLSNYQEICNLL